MPLQSTGEISFADIRAEFGGSGQVSISSYYRNGGRVPNDNFCCESADGGSIPGSGQIDFNDFRGTTNGNTRVELVAGGDLGSDNSRNRMINTGTGSTASRNYSPPANTRRVQYEAWAGSGGASKFYISRSRCGGMGKINFEVFAASGAGGGYVGGIYRVNSNITNIAATVGGGGGAASRWSTSQWSNYVPGGYAGGNGANTAIGFDTAGGRQATYSAPGSTGGTAGVAANCGCDSGCGNAIGTGPAGPGAGGNRGYNYTASYTVWGWASVPANNPSVTTAGSGGNSLNASHDNSGGVARVRRNAVSGARYLEMDEDTGGWSYANGGKKGLVKIRI